MNQSRNLTFSETHTHVHLLAACWAMGIMLSPESLVLLGNISGTAGISLIVILAAAALLYLMTAGTISRIAGDKNGSGEETDVLKQQLGNLAGTILPFAARGSVAVVGATAMLVTAGFVFNEVFVYWFPNFAAAFILLAVLLGIQLMGERARSVAQMVFASTAILGLLALTVAGLINMRPFPSESIAPASIAFHPGTRFLPLLLLVGFDLAGIASGNDPSRQAFISRGMMLAIIGAAFLLGLWAVASIRYVPVEKLADSTIPHMIAARRIMGQPGRYIMGIVVISGVCAAVNALFIGLSRLWVAMNRTGGLHGSENRSKSSDRAPLIVLALSAGAMMAAGMAGTEVLDRWFRGGLLLWMSYYAAIHMAAWRSGRRSPSATRIVQLLNIIACILLTVAVTVLVITDDSPAAIISFMILALALAASLFVMLSRLSRRNSCSCSAKRCS